MFSKHPEIKDAMLGRAQSPTAEDLMRDGIHDAIKELLETSYLYRNRAINVDGIKRLADTGFSAAALEDEFQHRPWTPYSRNRGFTSGERRMLHSTGGDPIGTPPREMRLTFIIPTVRTWCSTCNSHELHDSIPHIDISPYHLNPEAIQEPLGRQTFLFNLQCHRCKSPPITFMVRRELLKVQLCGRSKPYFPEVPPEIPKPFRAIYSDAVSAVACGDISGGFYHLRTLLEHHMKAACGIPREQQIVGSELCERYNAVCDPVVSARAALTDVFAQSSVHLHNRTGTPEEFETALARVRAHFRLIDNLRTLSPKM